MNVCAFRHQAKQLAFRMMAPWSYGWDPYQRLMLVGDGGGWVLDEEMNHLRRACRDIGLHTVAGGWAPVTRWQVVFYASQFVLLQPPEDRGHRLCFAYFHGRPGSGLPEFDTVFENLRRTRSQWARIQVSHSDMRDVVLSAGVEEEQVRVVPIAVRLSMYSLQTEASRRAARERLGIPQDAFVVGSFQKDGNGWGEGLEPKWIKGPDILVEALRALRSDVPELYVLLSGPARGYVKRRLEEEKIPYRHVFAKRYAEIPALYQALDVCMVSSRQEGGPKAVLESMASGVPLVTTRVGQAMDMVVSGQNGFMVAVEDVEGLRDSVQRVYQLSAEERQALVGAGRETAEAHSWERQGPLWQDFFEGIVE